LAQPANMLLYRASVMPLRSVVCINHEVVATKLVSEWVCLWEMRSEHHIVGARLPSRFFLFSIWILSTV
jgi:hypothetical protein